LNVSFLSINELPLCYLFTFSSVFNGIIMATTSSTEASNNVELIGDDLKHLVWGNSIKPDVFLRWSQGFAFSEDEPSALVQLAGGPCAVIAPVQAYLIKNMLFKFEKTSGWNAVDVDNRNKYLCAALHDILSDSVSESHCSLMVYDGDKTTEVDSDSDHQSNEDGEARAKKQRLSHEELHSNIRCIKCSKDSLLQEIQSNMSSFLSQYGVILCLYSVVISKGLDNIRGEMEDPSESLIDGVHGHGSQSLINLMLTGTAVSNVWDNDKQVSGLTLQGIKGQSTVGFLTQLEHLRYCEVGWYLKNPRFPVWLLGSETHLTVLFSLDRSLVSVESPEAAARRIFNSFDTDNCGFVQSSILGDLLQALDLVSEPEYVKIMEDKMDPEQLGIITLNCFMDEFFPADSHPEATLSFKMMHWNGLQSSCPNSRVKYHEGSAILLDQPEVQIITDTSTIKTCLMTKWPTIELTWMNNMIPSMN